MPYVETQDRSSVCDQVSATKPFVGCFMKFVIEKCFFHKKVAEREIKWVH